MMLLKIGTGGMYRGDEQGRKSMKFSEIIRQGPETKGGSIEWGRPYGENGDLKESRPASLVDKRTRSKYKTTTKMGKHCENAV